MSRRSNSANIHRIASSSSSAPRITSPRHPLGFENFSARGTICCDPSSAVRRRANPYGILKPKKSPCWKALSFPLSVFCPSLTEKSCCASLSTASTIRLVCSRQSIEPSSTVWRITPASLKVCLANAPSMESRRPKREVSRQHTAFTPGYLPAEMSANIAKKPTRFSTECDPDFPSSL